MKISIISTIFNKEKFLKSHLNSLLEQDYKDIEYIFVNDGSTDKSLDILYQEVKGKKNVIIIDQKNTGQSIARKNGFLRSTGDYIYFVDSDDTLFNDNVITSIMNVVNKDNEIDCVLGNLINSYDNCDQPDKCVYSSKIIEGKYDITFLYDTVFRNSLCYKIFRKSIIKEKNFINERNYEDGYFSYLTLNNCRNFYYYNKPFYVVNRKNINKSITSFFNVESIENKYLILNKLLTETKRFNISINKLTQKAYLDDYYSSLSLKRNDCQTLLKFLKKEKVNMKINYIISRHYFFVYIFKPLISNVFFNRFFVNSKIFVKKIMGRNYE